MTYPKINTVEIFPSYEKAIRVSSGMFSSKFRDLPVGTIFVFFLDGDTSQSYTYIKCVNNYAIELETGAIGSAGTAYGSYVILDEKYQVIVVPIKKKD